MKVLLVEDVEKLGWLGDVVEVKNGYARNYLLPQGLATIPTEANIKSLEAEKQRRAEIRRLERQQKEQLAARMEGAQVIIAAKANEMGHLFGSVTERDIADALRQQGFEVQDDMVKMPAGHIKEIGTHEVVLRIASDLRPAVRVVVVSEDQTVDADKKETNTQE
ncbi:MAG TPA: 50S ribosomal protein L9 [Anaerohalosphaeraceae bacterium]|nr:50S ribosomal protein L9 [Anaerohalosphaeraceae bacterium]HPC63354.1 50S ribosomal protein L9 [Anaerohalosphaeraceae bacterium]HRV19492.1 50S ribosomal protein L9 [Anaerohalosphaeraceae bacterium]